MTHLFKFMLRGNINPPFQYVPLSFTSHFAEASMCHGFEDFMFCITSLSWNRLQHPPHPPVTRLG